MTADASYAMGGDPSVFVCILTYHFGLLDNGTDGLPMFVFAGEFAILAPPVRDGPHGLRTTAQASTYEGYRIMLAQTCIEQHRAPMRALCLCANLSSAESARDHSPAHACGLPVRLSRGFAGTGGIFSFSR